MHLLFFLLIWVLTSCSSSSPEDYKEMGQKKARELLAELKKIKSRDQLMDASEQLERCYEEIADLMLLVMMHVKQQKSVEFSDQDHELNEKIRLELLRIYRIDGGREILEKCQKKALDKLQMG